MSILHMQNKHAGIFDDLRKSQASKDRLKI